MARRDSPLYNFIMDALIDNKYPFILYWIDRNEGIFCLKCLCKSKKGWNPSHSKIFDDYHKLKPRKSNDRRQRFLVAMRHCPFIEPLEEISTKEEKFYRFRTHATLSVDATEEIAALAELIQYVVGEEIPVASTTENGPIVNAADKNPTLAELNQDVEMKEISAVWTAENGPPSGDTSMENVCSFQSDSGSPTQTDSNNSLQGSQDDFNELISDIDDLLRRVNSTVPGGTEEDLGFPDIGVSASFYESNDLMRSLPSCSQAVCPDPSELCNFQGEEESFHFEVRAQDSFVPPDYDPAEDLIESMRVPETEVVNPLTLPEADLPQLVSVQMTPGTSGESKNCQSSVRVFKLDDNDGIVKSLRGGNGKKKFYMMVLNPKGM